MEKFKVWSTFLRKSAPAKLQNDSDDDEYEKLTEQVLQAFTLSSKEDFLKEKRKPKVPVKCAANFLGKAGSVKI